MKKTLIKNAKIYDGSGTPAFLGDVLIEGERIAQIAASIPVESEFEVVDLTGLSLAPGFIDAHSHNDWFALRVEPVKFFEPFVKQGITTFVSGNDALKGIEWAQVMELVRHGAMGNLIEVESADGDIVRIFVE